MASGAPSSSVSPSSSATSSASSSSGSNPGNRGANYFFGFLVTFIALLFIFIGCGVGTRRRLQRRRGAFLTELGGWNASSFVAEHEQQEPHLLEPRFVQGGDKWRSMQPLSITMACRDIPSKCSPAPIRSPSRNPEAYHGLSLPTWVSPTLQVEEKDDKSPTSNAHNETVQVAVMIAMPSRPREEQAEPEVPPSEYQIGVASACIPWTDPAHT